MSVSKPWPCYVAWPTMCWPPGPAWSWVMFQIGIQLFCAFKPLLCCSLYVLCTDTSALDFIHKFRNSLSIVLSSIQPSPLCSSWEGKEITSLLQEEGCLLPVAPGKEGKGQDFVCLFARWLLNRICRCGQLCFLPCWKFWFFGYRKKTFLRLLKLCTHDVSGWSSPELMLPYIGHEKFNKTKQRANKTQGLAAGKVLEPGRHLPVYLLFCNFSVFCQLLYEFGPGLFGVISGRNRLECAHSI